MTAERPDLGRIVESLKDFQRDTVEHVFRRLFTDADAVRRFLVADEVGLGKTLVARGVVALALDALWDRPGHDRIDIIYVCSNEEIARQNINRLNVTGRRDFAVASRITLLPIELHNLKGNRVNFVTLTPGTSFDLSSGLGMYRERALLYWLLDRAWGKPPRGARNLLCGSVDPARFRAQLREFQAKHTIDEDLADGFAADLVRRDAIERAAGQAGPRAEFDALCEAFRRGATPRDRDHRERRNRFVGALRQILAEACMQALEPDLIILDEFQRFKHLLQGDDAAAHLARGLFDYSRDEAAARVLLLSATPYKMYTTADEGDDDHYTDFLSTLRFLQNDQAATAECDQLIRRYRRSLLRRDADGTGAGAGAAIDLCRTLEARLRKVMVRTERLAVTPDRDGMLATVPAGLELRPDEVTSYLALQQIARAAGQTETIEFWKSAPYPLSFMESYRLKDDVRHAAENPARRHELRRALAGAPLAVLPWQAMRRYEPIEPGNARMRWLAGETVDRGAWRLLWVPPSLPYYRLTGAFGEPALTGFTKRLIFSSWIVAPKAIAGLLSYDAEQRMFRGFDPEAANTEEDRKRRRGLLRFAAVDGRLTGMPLFLFLYPSYVLAELGDPLRAAGEELPVPGADVVLEAARDRIRERLAPWLTAAPSHGPEDETWYWAAPILLDHVHDPEACAAWLGRPDLPTLWQGQDATEDSEGDGAWGTHVRRLATAPTLELGRPPADLMEVLAEAAVAAPATAALRGLARVHGGWPALGREVLRTEAARIGWAFRTLFNVPEVMALLRGSNAAEPYWRRALEYCVAGCLSAVLDEYVHVLREHRGLVGHEPAVSAADLGDQVRGAVGLRTAVLQVDNFVATADGRVRLMPERLRSRFAMRYGTDATEDGRGQSRAESVRAAFNSPFWPFVLATTSVGQEGLDFHLYSHAVVHWNVPSNPVDLEQREGRVHRYKGHAVRKNLAHRFRSGLVAPNGADPWERLFEAARCARAPEVPDIVPYWVFGDGPARIQRHVPALPLSREAGRLPDLQRDLAAYRLVFGQPRQEELLAFLMAQPEGAAPTEVSRIDLSPRPGDWRKAPRPKAAVAAVEFPEIAWVPAAERDNIGVKPKGEALARTRGDADFAERLLRQCLPDRAAREAFERRLVAVAALAHATHPGSWGVTVLAGGGDPLRLNVGWLEVMALCAGDSVRLVVLGSRLPRTLRKRLRDDNAWVYRSDNSPELRGVYVHLELPCVARWLPELAPAHDAFVNALLRRIIRGTPYRSSHSPGVVEYLRRAGHAMPSPAYAGTT